MSERRHLILRKFCDGVWLDGTTYAQQRDEEEGEGNARTIVIAKTGNPFRINLNLAARRMKFVGFWVSSELFYKKNRMQSIITYRSAILAAIVFLSVHLDSFH